MSVDRKMKATESSLTEPRVVGGWLAVVLVFAILSSILLSFREYVAMVLHAWETLPSHAHGYVVLLVVGYLLWTKRPQLQDVVCRPSWKGLVALTLTGLLAMLGEIASVAAVVQFAIIFMMFCAVWAVVGDKAARATLGPLSFLLFAVPVGHEALPVLMNWTADATVVALRHSGVPVFQEGRNFVIPSGRWSVVEACGGIRYLLTSVFVGAVFAYLTYTRFYKRVLFMAWAFIMPLIANWLRAYVIVIVAHLTNNEWGLGMSHLALGWVIFGVSIFASFAVGVRWRDELPAALPLQVTGRPAMSVLAAGALTAFIPFGWHFLATQVESQELGQAPVLRLESLSTLERERVATSGIRPSFPGARAVHQMTYSYKGEPVDLYIAYYRNQRQGAELISVLNNLEPTKDWSWATSSNLQRADSVLPEVRLEGYFKDGRYAAVYQFYWVNGMTTTGDAMSKLLDIVSRLRGRGDDAAAIVVTAYSTENLDAARMKTEAFTAAHMAGILDDLSRVASSEK